LPHYEGKKILKSPYLDNGLVLFHIFLRVGYMYTLHKRFSKNQLNQVKDIHYTINSLKKFQTLNPKSKNLTLNWEVLIKIKQLANIGSDSSADSTPKKVDC